MKVVVALKPEGPWDPLDTATGLVRPPASLTMLSLIRVGVQGDERERLDQAEARLESRATRLRDAGYEVDVQAQVSSVSAGGDIARQADWLGPDLLVIGLGGRSRVGKALLGSDAQTVLLSVSVPVLCVRGDAQPPGPDEAQPEGEGQ